MPFDFAKDPTTHVPQRDPRTTILERWGIVDAPPTDALDDDSNDPMLEIFNRMNSLTGMSYLDRNTARNPEQEFIHNLKIRKITELKSYTAEPGNIPCRRDYVFDVHLTQCEVDGKPVVTRRFKCSGDVNLRTWVDKMLIPILGYCRGYHGWVLTDQSDGAVFAPTGIQAVDMIHLWNHGVDAIDDVEYTIAHVLRKEGDAFGWIYDLGDQYRHLITVSSIFPAAESTGTLEVISGTGASPPENFDGNLAWHETIESLLSDDVDEDTHELIARSPNYMQRHELHHGPPAEWKLDPWKFDIEEVKMNLEFDLEQKISEKKNKMTGGVSLSAEIRKRTAVCGGCGRVEAKDGGGGGLLRCKACKTTWYCGPECQKRKWRVHRTYCKGNGEYAVWAWGER